ncbi:MAG: ATP-binding protein [Candidatus Marithrix sp.]
MEKILLKSEYHFRSYFEAASIGLIITSPERYWLYANSCACDMLGYSLTELQTMTWNTLTHPDDLSIDTDKFKRLMDSEIDGYNIDKRFICKDKTIIYIFLSVTACYQENGEIDHIVATLQDITERKQMEESLRQAKQQAENANKAKTTFLSNMNHELRTPLNGILGYANILRQDGGLTTLQQNGLDIIHSSGEHLLALINDILDISKIEANKMELYPTKFDLCDFLEDIISIIRMRAQQKYIWLALKADEDLPSTIKMDETRLRQILINLIGNAIKFTDNGGTVIIRVTRRLSKLTFEIEDTGIGLTTEQAIKVFQPFEQVGDIKQKAEGTGLGLSISQQLVNLMGGEISIVSEYGKGSTFGFEVPFIEIKPLPNKIETSAITIDSDIIPPSQDKLVELHELAILGLIQRLENQANQLDEKKFANIIIELTKKFDDEQLLIFIEKFMK